MFFIDRRQDLFLELNEFKRINSLYSSWNHKKTFA